MFLFFFITYKVAIHTFAGYKSFVYLFLRVCLHFINNSYESIRMYGWLVWLCDFAGWDIIWMNQNLNASRTLFEWLWAVDWNYHFLYFNTNSSPLHQHLAVFLLLLYCRVLLQNIIRGQLNYYITLNGHWKQYMQTTFIFASCRITVRNRIMSAFWKRAVVYWINTRIHMPFPANRSDFN